MLSSPKRKLALTLGYPKISIKTQTSVSPGFRVKITFGGKKEKKKSDPQISAITGLHLAL